MLPLRRVGLEQALTEEEWRFIDEAIVKAVRPQLIARRLFPVYRLPDAGYKVISFDVEGDMGQATISMTGSTGARDKVKYTRSTVTIPVIHKDFKIHWRDMLASRHRGESLDVSNALSAARQVAEEEDKLLITGEYTGWPALGIEGLATATGRNTTTGGDWSANMLTYVANAIKELQDDGFITGPYHLVIRSSWYAQMLSLISNTAEFYVNKVAELLGGPKEQVIHISNSLYASDGGVDNALVVKPGAENFDLAVGQDITTFQKENEDMDLLFKVYEVLAPRVKRPTSICEITSLT